MNTKIKEIKIIVKDNKGEEYNRYFDVLNLDNIDELMELIKNHIEGVNEYLSD